MGLWRVNDSGQRTAMLTPVPNSPPPSADFVRHCLDTLAGDGYAEVVTGALSPIEQVGFLAAGFEVAERLRLLGMRLDSRLSDVPPGRRLTRSIGSRRDEILGIDSAAFQPFWRFDKSGLEGSMKATPRARLRVAVSDDGTYVGYAVSGRAGNRGFVQRLAVLPSEQGQGTGKRLLLDGLHWMRRRGARHVVVNTQLDNSTALKLYRSIGFHDEPTGLSVLSKDLTADSAQR